MSRVLPILLMLGWSAAFAGPAATDTFAVRVEFQDRQQFLRLVAHAEPWEVHPDPGQPELRPDAVPTDPSNSSLESAPIRPDLAHLDLAPGSVPADRGYLVIEASQADIRRLQAEGFKVSVDPLLTARLNAPPRPTTRSDRGIPGYPCYRGVDETFQAALDLVQRQPQLATWLDIGDSWRKTVDPDSGDDLWVLRLSNPAVPGPKPKMLITAALHAREYVTVETALRFAESLVNGYGIDPDATWLLDHQEFHFLLIANPDGRREAQSGILWRKNANNAYCPDSTGRGVDLNRNFGFHWGCCSGGSSSECSETFRGLAPQTEPESQAIVAYLQAEFPDRREADPMSAAEPGTWGMYIDLHSYGQRNLRPWGFSRYSGDQEAMHRLARKLAFYNKHSPQAAMDYNPADGMAIDFAYGELGVASLLLELGTWFFQDCTTYESTIDPLNQKALHYAARVVRAPYNWPAGPEIIGLTANPATTPAGGLVTITALADDSRFNTTNERQEPIAEASLALDHPSWSEDAILHPMRPENGAFDTLAEPIRLQFSTADLAPGRHLLFVQARDAAGNLGPPSAVFLDILDPSALPVQPWPTFLLLVLPALFWTRRPGSRPNIRQTRST